MLPGAPQEATFEEERPGLVRRAQHFLHAFPTTIPFLVLLIGVIFFSGIVGGKFFAPFNLSLILQQVTIIATLGIAQTLVILTAGIDLSVGVIMILSLGGDGPHGGGLWRTADHRLPARPPRRTGLRDHQRADHHDPPATAVHCDPRHVEHIRRAQHLLFPERDHPPAGHRSDSPFLQLNGTIIKPYDLLLKAGLEVSWLKGSVITYGSILMVLLAIAVWYVLNRTAFGRHIYATGDDPSAARLAGISTNRTLVAVYALAGLICAIAAWVLIGRIGGVSPQAGQTANLDSITAVVIGGTSLFGGRGSIVGTLIGALIVGVFRNGLALSGLDVLWQEFTVGVLIIVAVTLDQWIRKVAA